MQRKSIIDEVRGYIDAVGTETERILARYPEAAGLRDVIELAMSKSIGRKGKLDGDVEYSIHGVGCLFTRKNGVEIDVDTDFFRDGARIFDVWRLKIYLETSGMVPMPSEKDLQEACDELARVGAVQARGSWYTPDRA